MAEPLTAVIGADGGNSKTDLVVASLDGDLLARVRGAGTCQSVVGAAATARDTAELVRRALSMASVAVASVRVAVLDYANLDMPVEEEEFASAIAPHRIAEEVVIGNDTLAVLQAGSPDGWGAAVVCGAGINAVAIDRSGRRETFLSLGRLSGDEGGGAGIVAEAQYHAIRAEDGRGGVTALRTTLPAHFGLAAPSELAIAVHRGEISAATFLAAAPVVFATANAGDAVARGIVERTGREAAVMVGTLHRRLALPADAPIVLGGSVLQSGEPLLLSAFRAALDALVPGAEWVVLDVAPVAGAVDTALRLAGATPQARTRARDCLRTPC
jgi:N-acetylglucosamine kinase-like BadF-type ATPase